MLVVLPTVWCPRCDQGWVVRRRVRGREKALLVCRECDTVCEHGPASNRGPFPLLEEYLGRLGVEPRWTSLNAWDARTAPRRHDGPRRSQNGAPPQRKRKGDGDV